MKLRGELFKKKMSLIYKSDESECRKRVIQIEVKFLKKK